MAIISHQEAHQIARQYYNNNGEFQGARLADHIDARITAIMVTSLQSLGHYLQHYGVAVQNILNNAQNNNDYQLPVQENRAFVGG